VNFGPLLESTDFRLLISRTLLVGSPQNFAWLVVWPADISEFAVSISPSLLVRLSPSLVSVYVSSPVFIACNIYISRLCYDGSVRLYVTEVHWRIIANLGFKFGSKFTAHCARGEG